MYEVIFMIVISLFEKAFFIIPMLLLLLGLSISALYTKHSICQLPLTDQFSFFM